MEDIKDVSSNPPSRRSGLREDPPSPGSAFGPSGLGRRDEYLKNIFDNTSDIVYRISADRVFLDLNPAFTRMTGWQVDDWIGRTFTDLVHPDDLNRLAERIQEILEGCPTSPEVWRIRCRTGGYSLIEFVAFPNHDDQGRVVDFFGIGRDVTERFQTEDSLRRAGEELTREVEHRTAQLQALNRKLELEIQERIRTEAALKENQGHMRSLLESTGHFAIFRLVHDESQPFWFRVVLVSPSIKEILGIDTPETFSSWFENIHPEDAPRVVQAHRRAFLNQKFNETMRIFNKHLKEWRYIHSISTGIVAGDHHPLHVNGIMLDVTEHKIAEQTLLAYQDRLRSMSAEISLIEERERRRIAMNLHDNISQSLAICRMKLEQLRRAMKQPSDIEEIIQLVSQMAQETRSLTLDLSPPVLYELGLGPALEWLVDRMGEQHEIKTYFSAHCQRQTMTEDIRILLFRSVQELLMNVVKHAKASRISVDLIITDKAIRIEVADNGIGFAPKALDPRTDYQGRFGLFSIRERLGSLNGKLDISSSPQGGTRIVLSAPLTAREDPDR